MTNKYQQIGAIVKGSGCRNSSTALVIATSLFCGSAQSVEVGFEGLLTYEFRQNTDEINFPEDDIPDSEFALGSFSVFGEHRTRKVNAVFQGSIESERDLPDDDNDDGTFDTDTRFMGALDFAITPRSLRWYVGDVLTGVRNEESFRIADDINENSTNVFVTGPIFETEVAGFSRTQARLFYVTQSEDDELDRSIVNFRASHLRDTVAGGYYGARINDIYTKVEEDDDQNIGFVAPGDQDFNRLSLSLVNNRVRQFTDLYGEIGVTRYTTDNDTTDGLAAELRTTRRLGPESFFSVGITHSLNDETLNTIEAVFRGDPNNAGLRPEVDGIFQETRIDASYSINADTSDLDLGLSIAQLDYRLITGDMAENISVDGQDRIQGTVNARYAKSLSGRFRSIFSAAYEVEDFTNRDDNSDALLLSANFIYGLTESFDLELSFDYDLAEGLFTNGLIGDVELLEIDESETRASIGIRWAPVTRASRQETVEITSLAN